MKKTMFLQINSKGKDLIYHKGIKRSRFWKKVKNEVLDHKFIYGFSLTSVIIATVILITCY